MNVALFLTPKTSVAWIPAAASVRDALERLDAQGYTAVPILDGHGVYLGTLTEGDLLRAVRSPGVDLDRTAVSDRPLRSDNRAVPVVAASDAVVEVAVDQNFVPVVDSRGVLMGIVTRKAILEYLWKRAGGR